MKTLKAEYKIKAQKKLVWDALVNPRTINKWGAGPSKMKAEKGFKFSLWGGDIHGVNTEVVKEKILKQDWMAGKWEEYSKVSFTLTEKDGVTHILLKHEGIPPPEFKEIEDGWLHYYFAPLKKLLENSSKNV